jgi:transcriptional regulator with XRE-family HTH domain
VSRDERTRLQEAFGRRLREAREAASYMDAADFAVEVGVEAPRYRQDERGESVPPIDVLRDIVVMTQQSLDRLMLGQRRR